MVTQHPQLTKILSDTDINELIADSDYIGYVPYIFIRDLYSVWTWYLMEGSIDSAFISPSEYDKLLYKLLKELMFVVNFELDSTVFILKTLNLFSNRLDFREVEIAKISGNLFDIDTNDTQKNYKFVYNNINFNVKKALDIPTTEPNNRLSRKIETLLYTVNEIKFLPGIEETKFSYTRTSMTKYSQISKVLKHKLITPLFKYKFSIKDLPVKYPGISRNSAVDIVLMIDVSESTKNNDSYHTLVDSIILYYINIYNVSIKITVVLYAHYIVDILHITSVNDLIELYQTERRPVLQEYGWTGAFNSIEQKFANHNIVCVHDGEGSFIVPRTINNNWYIVSFKFNKYLNKLAKKSKGNYIEYDIKQ